MKDSTRSNSDTRAIYRWSLAFRPICDLEVSGAMRAAQSVIDRGLTGGGEAAEAVGREERRTVFRILSKASSIFQA